MKLFRSSRCVQT